MPAATFVLESFSMVPRLILASNSPRRRQLLALTGWKFDIRPVEIDERALPGEPPEDYVLRLAKQKAQAASLTALPDEVILTADTTVADGCRILGKPAAAAEAREMLRSLRGRPHTVFTAFGITSSPSCASPVTHLCATRVWMRDYTDAEIEKYIASGDPYDKAGAYAIQHLEFNPADRIEGCYACVVGLPVCHVVGALAPFGFSTALPVTVSCQEALQLDSPCPVGEMIFQGIAR